MQKHNMDFKYDYDYAKNNVRPDHASFHHVSTSEIFLHQSSQTDVVYRSFPVPSLTDWTLPQKPDQLMSP